MSKRIRSLLIVFLAVFCFAMSSTTTAFAFVDPEWEEGKGPDETAYPTDAASTIVEPSPSPTIPEQAFSTPGNGDLGDAIKSGKKDFYTIHTKNNNTFYLVIDHAGNVDNVYMLSLIDENDLSDFIKESEKKPEKQQQVVVLPEPTTQPQTEPVVTPEPKTENNGNLMTLVVFALVGGGAAFFYFKVYKPRKEAESIESENMETGDGLPYEREAREKE